MDMLKVVEGFDVCSWSQDCSKFERNKAQIGFNSSCHITDGKIKLKLSDIPEKFQRYRKGLHKLMLKNAQGAVIVICRTLSPYYAAESDYEEEEAHLSKVINENLEQYLQVLYDQGKDKFMEIICNQFSIEKIHYISSHIKMVDGMWTLPNGDVWIGNGWRRTDNTVYYDAYTNVWKDLFSVTMDEKSLPDEAEAKQSA